MRYLVPVVLALFAAPALAQNTATLSFTAPTVDAEGGPIVGTLSYKVYQGLKGQTKTLAATITTTAHTVSSGLQSGREYCWQVSAIQTVDAVPSAESALSAEACKRFPVAPSAPVTGLTVR